MHSVYYLIHTITYTTLGKESGSIVISKNSLSCLTVQRYALYIIRKRILKLGMIL